MPEPTKSPGDLPEKAPLPAPEPPKPDAPVIQATLTPAPGAVDAMRDREQKEFARRLAADDKAREESADVTLVATAGFTIVEDPDKPEGRVVQAGEEFTVAASDLPRYLGRGVPKALEAGKPGVNVQQNPE